MNAALLAAAVFCLQESDLEKAGRDIAAAIHKGMAEGDTKAFDTTFDIDALLDAVTAGVPTSDALKAGFRKATADKTVSQMSGQIAKVVKEGGSYSFLRMKTEGGSTRALFRLVTGGALNYHELVFAKRGGSVRIVDMYIYAAGESFADIMRRLYTQAAVEANREALGKLEEKDQVLIKNGHLLLQMSQQTRAGEFKAALRTYASMPEAMQKMKIVMLGRIQAAQGADEEEYAKAIEAFETRFTGDPSLDLLSIDSFFLKKKYDDALKVLDRLDKRLGGDPYLDIMRGNLWFLKDDIAKAKAAFTKAAKPDPTLIDAWWSLVTVSMHEKDWKETGRLLTAISKTFELELADLETIPDYADYVKTPEYREWLKGRGK